MIVTTFIQNLVFPGNLDEDEITANVDVSSELDIEGIGNIITLPYSMESNSMNSCVSQHPLMKFMYLNF